MKWYMEKNGDSSVAISSRIRLARNLEKMPFPNRESAADSEKVVRSVIGALKSAADEHLNFIDMSKLSDNDRRVLLEDHTVSPEFCEPTSLSRFLVTDENGSLAIMINEEDHIRTQVITAGLSLSEAFARANRIDDMIGTGVNYAFDSELGFLTSCPTNLGTGMRASVMLHLPALTANGQIGTLGALLTKLGLTVRGLYGEGSSADGCLYQISNETTLGVSEKDTIEKLEKTVSEICSKETELRKKLYENSKEKLEDKLYRSFGLLKYAKSMDTAEFLKLWSNVKLGADMGVIPEAQNVNLTSMLVEAMPAHLIKNSPDAKRAELRDAIRAKTVSERLKESEK